MFTRKTLLAAALVLPFGSVAIAADAPKLGKPITDADIAAWDIAIMPDGTGLPPGSGPLAGGGPLAAGIDTPKTIGNFYGYATTVFDFTRRSMPFNMPLTLTDNEVYALTAYI